MKKRKKSIMSVILAVLMGVAGFKMFKEVASDFKKFINNSFKAESDNQDMVQDIVYDDVVALNNNVVSELNKEGNTLSKPYNPYDKVNSVDMYGYVNDNTTLFSACEDYLGDVQIEKFQKVYVLYESEEYDYVIEESGRYGFIKKDDVTLLGNEYIEVDISDQLLYYYVNGELKLETDVVTGRDNKYDTRVGSFEIYEKTNGRYLVGEDYRVWVDYWMRFDKGIGLHDATWRKGRFGSEIYKTNGSHGCVNMPYEEAEYIYKNANLKTKVLVHK